MTHGEGSINTCVFSPPLCPLQYPTLCMKTWGPVPSRQVQPPPGSPVPCRHTLPKSNSSSGSLCVQAVLGFPSPKLPSHSSIPIYLFYPTISLSHANLHHRILSLVRRKLRGQPIYPQPPSGKWGPFPDPPNTNIYVTCL